MQQAYIDHDPQVSSWFAAGWDNLERLPLEHWQGNRSALIATLKDANPQLTPRQKASLADLEKHNGFIVCCGQQPAIGGGPSMVLHKAIHTVALCRELQSAGHKAVPLFWCASDDHDAGEANHIDVVDRQGSVHRWRWSLPQPGAALHRQEWSQTWPEILNHLASHLGSGPGETFVQDMAPLADEGLGEWLCRLLRRLLGPHGLLCIEAKDLRHLWSPRWSEVIREWPREALSSRWRAIADRGMPLTLPEETLLGPPVFQDLANERRRVEGPELDHLVATAPETLSPGAGLRPILQQVALPVGVWCAGPGELTYHAGIGPVYDAMNLPMPKLVPRFGATVLSANLRRAVDRLGMDPRHPVANQGKSEIPTPSLLTLDTALSDLDKTQTDPDTRKRIETGMRRLQRERDRLLASLERGARHRAGLPSAGATLARLRPRQQPQERIQNMLQELWELGPGIVDHMLERVPRHPTSHIVFG